MMLKPFDRQVSRRRHSTSIKGSFCPTVSVEYSIEDYSFSDTIKAEICEDLSIDFSEIDVM